MALRMSIGIKPKAPAARFRKFAKQFEEEAVKVHRSGVITVLGWYVRWSRWDTGRFVHGWMPYADVNGYSLEAAVVKTGEGDPSAWSEGRKSGTFEDVSPLHTRVINGVKYAEYLDDKVGVFNNGTFLSKLAQSEKIYSDKIQEFLDAADKMNESGEAPVIRPSGPAGSQ